jgi:hypothetical protein
MSKDFTIGSLKHTVVFKKNTRGSLGIGSKDHYETFLTTRCSLKKRRAIKQSERGRVMISGFYEMVCRFEINLLNQISGSVLCVIDNVEYTVHDFDLKDEKQHLYEFIISKSVA